MDKISISRSFDGTLIIIRINGIEMSVENDCDYYSDALELEKGKVRKFKLEEIK